jgi:hypothetical protein
VLVDSRESSDYDDNRVGMLLLLARRSATFCHCSLALGASTRQGIDHGSPAVGHTEEGRPGSSVGRGKPETVRPRLATNGAVQFVGTEMGPLPSQAQVTGA